MVPLSRRGRHLGDRSAQHSRSRQFPGGKRSGGDWDARGRYSPYRAHPSDRRVRGAPDIGQDWADWEQTKRSYELIARYVMPHFNDGFAAAARSLQFQSGKSRVTIGGTREGQTREWAEAFAEAASSHTLIGWTARSKIRTPVFGPNRSSSMKTLSVTFVDILQAGNLNLGP